MFDRNAFLFEEYVDFDNFYFKRAVFRGNHVVYFPCAHCPDCRVVWHRIRGKGRIDIYCEIDDELLE